MVEELNKKLIETAIREIGNQCNLDIIPQLFSTDFVQYYFPNDSQTTGLTELTDFLKHRRKAFPDWCEEIKLMIAEKDLVAIWFRSTGTNRGPFLGHPPTGRRIDTNVMSIFRINEGLIAEQWLLPDLWTMNSQVGFIPRKEHAEVNPFSECQFQVTQCKSDSATRRSNKELALKANVVVWNQGDFGNLEEMFASDFVQHLLPLGTRTVGLKEFRHSSIAHRTAFPDWSEDVNLVVAQGDFVALEYTSTGTNSGSFSNQPPTGRSIVISEMTIFRMAAGKIAEQWLLPDMLSLNQQLGYLTSGT